MMETRHGLKFNLVPIHLFGSQRGNKGNSIIVGTGLDSTSCLVSIILLIEKPTCYR